MAPAILNPNESPSDRWITVPDKSMAPTLLAGDSMLVEAADADADDLDGAVFVVAVQAGRLFTAFLRSRAAVCG